MNIVVQLILSLVTSITCFFWFVYTVENINEVYNKHLKTKEETKKQEIQGD